MLWGNRGELIIAALFLHGSYVFDVGDGLLARVKNTFTPFGGWYDGISDRIKEFIILYSFAYRLGPFTAETLLPGMYAFALIAFYHGYMLRNLPTRREAGHDAPHQHDSVINAMRRRLKLGFFNLGEQFFLYTIFLLWGNFNLFFWVFNIYGTLWFVSFAVMQFRQYYQKS
jgi:phosphatidylglycerophosphate synthase